MLTQNIDEGRAVNAGPEMYWQSGWVTGGQGWELMFLFYSKFVINGVLPESVLGPLLFVTYE